MLYVTPLGKDNWKLFALPHVPLHLADINLCPFTVLYISTSKQLLVGSVHFSSELYLRVILVTPKLAVGVTSVVDLEFGGWCHN